MTILLAVLGLVVVKALAESPWGLFTIAATIPLAMVMGVALRSGKFGVGAVSAFGVVGLLAAVVWREISARCVEVGADAGASHRWPGRS